MFPIWNLLILQKRNKRTRIDIFKLAKWDTIKRFAAQASSLTVFKPTVTSTMALPSWQQAWGYLDYVSFQASETKTINSKHEVLMACPPKQNNCEDTLHITSGAAAQYLYTHNHCFILVSSNQLPGIPLQLSVCNLTAFILQKK